MIETGRFNELEVVKILSFGAYLSEAGGTEEILLPLKYIPEGTEIGSLLDVFIYNDNENRPVATTLKPFAQVCEFALLTVKETSELGAFLDWGIAKDLFVPFREQRMQMQEGKKYIVYIYIDESTGRITASSKYAKFIDNKSATFSVGQEVELIVSEHTDLGYKAIINNQYLGLIYNNEVFEKIYVGDIKRGYIKLLRDDGKIDLSLQKQGYAHVEDSKLLILHYLKLNNGIIALGDKSSPEEIYKKLKISKKAFKKTIGGLYKEAVIEISDHEIKLK